MRSSSHRFRASRGNTRNRKRYFRDLKISLRQNTHQICTVPVIHQDWVSKFVRDFKATGFQGLGDSDRVGLQSSGRESAR